MVSFSSLSSSTVSVRYSGEQVDALALEPADRGIDEEHVAVLDGALHGIAARGDDLDAGEVAAEFFARPRLIDMDEIDDFRRLIVDVSVAQRGDDVQPLETDAVIGKAV